jgi:hypothetical protein
MSGKRVVLAAVAAAGVAASGFAAFEIGIAELPAAVANPSSSASPVVASTAGESTPKAVALDFCLGPDDRGHLRPITLQICFSDGHDGRHDGGGYRGGRGGYGGGRHGGY